MPQLCMLWNSLESKLFFDNYLHPSNGNCTIDLDIILVGCSEVNDTQHQGKNEEDVPLPRPFDVPELDYQVPLIEENMMSTNAITYVAGYLKNALNNILVRLADRNLYRLI